MSSLMPLESLLRNYQINLQPTEFLPEMNAGKVFEKPAPFTYDHSHFTLRDFSSLAWFSLTCHLSVFPPHLPFSN